MKASRTIAAALALLVVAGVLATPITAAPGPQNKKPEPKAPAKPSMPKEIEAVIQEGLMARQGRQDIPFSVFKTLVLPAQANNLYPVVFFKAKNSDLGYVPSPSGSGAMETNLNAFFEFFQADATGALKARFGGKIQALLTADGAGYAPDKEDWYSFGLALPAGKYTMALVLGTPDMKKLSVAYADINLPGADTLAAALLPSEPVIVTSFEQIEPDQRLTIHRGCFTWGAAKVAINVDGEVSFASGEFMEVLLFVIGAANKDATSGQPLKDLEVTFQFMTQDGTPSYSWPAKPYESFLVTQPLPLFQNLQKQDEKGTILSTDKKPLDPGKYVLAVTVLDKVTGNKGEAKMPFTVK